MCDMQNAYRHFCRYVKLTSLAPKTLYCPFLGYTGIPKANSIFTHVFKTLILSLRYLKMREYADAVPIYIATSHYLKVTGVW